MNKRWFAISAARRLCLGGLAAAVWVGTAPVGRAAIDPQPASEAQAAPPTLRLVAQVGILQRGDAGAAVGDLQRRLQSLGLYGGAIDEVFGSETEAAVIRFQERSGLVPDGIVGAETAARLAAQFDAPPSAAVDSLLGVGDRGEEVRDLQLRLSELGFYQGAIDGVYGTSTEAAVIDFQRSRGLIADGVVGPQTLAALSGTAGGFPVLPSPPVTALPALPPPIAVPQQPIATTPTRPTGRFTVAELQRRLQERGFYQGPIDGLVGPQTRSAIAAAQRAYNLSYSDIVEGRFE